MRFCYLSYGSWERNAAHLRSRGLGTELIARGMEVVYIVDDLPYNRTSLGLDPAARVCFVPAAHPARQVLMRRKLITEIEPTVLHICGPHPKTMAAVAGLDGVTVVGDWDEPPVFRDLGRARHALERIADHWLRQRADHIVVCTRYLKDRFRDVHELEASYIPHAIYLEELPDGPSPFSKPTAVYLGSFQPEWDHDVIFEAARLLAHEGCRPPIEFVGAGPAMDHWRHFTQRNDLDNVTFAGWLTGVELWRHLRSAHISLFPIRDTVLNKARCPSKIFAYAQARRPLLTNRVGELPELLGEVPTYLPDDSPEAFASGIHDAMSSARAPDVDYGAERHTYADRVTRLLEAIGAPSSSFVTHRSGPGRVGA